MAEKKQEKKSLTKESPGIILEGSEKKEEKIMRDLRGIKREECIALIEYVRNMFEYADPVCKRTLQEDIEAAKIKFASLGLTCPNK